MEKTEAMKILKDFHDKSALFSVRTALDTIIPELKKSESEIVIAALKSGINGLLKKEYHLKGIGGITFDRINAWLEKQGEHANFINKIQIGDNVTRNEAGILVNISQLNRVAKERKKQGEQNHKFRIGDKVTNGEDTYTINFIDKDCYWVKEHDCATIPFEYQHHWKLVEQNHAWSEEDEGVLLESISVLQNNSHWILADKLKSFKERYTWKPSDEQIETLEQWLRDNRYKGDARYCYSIFYSLYQDLKKIKGE